MIFSKLRSLLLLFALFLVLGTLIPQKTQAQQEPLYAHYMFNKFAYNPAYAGINREFICATFLFHNQWTGFAGPDEEKAPVTQTFTIHGAPAKKSHYFGGVGLNVLNDVQGFEYTRSFTVAASGRLELPIGIFHYGINGGMVERGISGDKWRPPDNGPDPYIPPTSSDMIPDLGVGLYLESPFYWAGFSVQHLIGGQFNWSGSQNTMVRTMFLTGGVNFPWPTIPDLWIKPSGLVRMDPAKVQFEINALAEYKQRFWGGLQYRQADAVSLLLGLTIIDNQKNSLWFGYSYDLTTSELLKYSSGTHEVMVKYCFPIVIKTEDRPPNIIWTPRFM